MSDVQLTTKDVAELSRLLAAGDVSAVDVTRAHLDRIAAEDGELGSYLHVDPDAALASAAAVDEARSGGTELGPLAGVPVALKDLVVTEGVPTTSGSKTPEGGAPPPTPRSPPASPTPAPSCSARPTWTSSRWAPPPRTPPTRSPATPGI